MLGRKRESEEMSTSAMSRVTVCTNCMYVIPCVYFSRIFSLSSGVEVMIESKHILQLSRIADLIEWARG